MGLTALVHVDLINVTCLRHAPLSVNLTLHFLSGVVDDVESIRKSIFTS